MRRLSLFDKKTEIDFCLAVSRSYPARCLFDAYLIDCGEGGANPQLQ